MQRDLRVEKFDFDKEMPGDTVQTLLPSLSLAVQAGGKGMLRFFSSLFV